MAHRARVGEVAAMVRVIGFALMASPGIVILALYWREYGLLPMLSVLGALAAVFGVITLGAFLASQ